RARAAAGELAEGLREGDAVAVVLAGAPARLGLAPTTDIATARRILGELQPTDRATDLGGAIALARAALRELPQRDRRVLLLSDLAGPPLPEGDPPVSTPLPALAERAEDCGITSAEQRGGRLTVRVACTSADVARGRRVEVTSGTSGADAAPGGQGAASAELSSRPGEQTLTLEVGGARDRVRLTGTDALPEDDVAGVAAEGVARRVAVVADPERASARTGGETVVEQALRALDSGHAVVPLDAVPEDGTALAGAAALVLDDPRGLGPESRDTVTAFVEGGGVLVALLGPRSTSIELGATLEPLGSGTPRWEATALPGLDPAGLAFLGEEGRSLADLGLRGRARLEGLGVEGAEIVGRFTDGAPAILRRGLGRGVVLAVGLPASLDVSDLALRAGFLSLLDWALVEGDLRRGAGATVAGERWVFRGAARVGVEGPGGPLPVTRAAADTRCAALDPACAGDAPSVTPELHGRHQVTVDGVTEARIVTLAPTELLAEPRSPVEGTATASATTREERPLLPVSREATLVVLGLVAVELALRAVRAIGARARARDA
ncbi:MAG: VWA domain-containing protein, partial [Deltaproteobacteria bacterium]|nr:VWA domain-containing protein [Deltaproteobacteria bacterium]